MGIEADRRRVGIHVKAVGSQAGNLRTRQFAAECEHDPVVGRNLPATGRSDGHLLFRNVKGVAVDKKSLDLAGKGADLVKLTSRTYGGSQAGKSGAEHKDARHLSSCSSSSHGSHHSTVRTLRSSW